MEVEFIIAGPGKEADITAPVSYIIWKMYDEYNDIFLQELGAFKGTSSLQVKEGTKPFQALPQHMTYIP